MAENQEEQALKTVNKKRQKSDNYKKTFHGASGKFVLLDLFKEFHMLKTSFVAGQRELTDYNEGSRKVILHILKEMNVSETEYLQLLTEAAYKNEQDLLDTI